MTEEKKHSVEFNVRPHCVRILKEELIDETYEDNPELEKFIKNIIKCKGNYVCYFDTYEEYQHIVEMIYTVADGDCEVFNCCTTFEW